MRTCRKCARTLPVSEFSKIQRSFVCSKCLSSFTHRKKMQAEKSMTARWATTRLIALCVASRELKSS